MWGKAERKTERKGERENVPKNVCQNCLGVCAYIYNVIMSPFGAQRLLFDLFIKKRTEDPKTDGMYIILHL